MANDILCIDKILEQCNSLYLIIGIYHFIIIIDITSWHGTFSASYIPTQTFSSVNCTLMIYNN